MRTPQKKIVAVRTNGSEEVVCTLPSLIAVLYHTPCSLGLETRMGGHTTFSS